MTMTRSSHGSSPSFPPRVTLASLPARHLEHESRVELPRGRGNSQREIQETRYIHTTRLHSNQPPSPPYLLPRDTPFPQFLKHTHTYLTPCKTPTPDHPTLTKNSVIVGSSNSIKIIKPGFTWIRIQGSRVGLSEWGEGSGGDFPMSLVCCVGRIRS